MHKSASKKISIFITGFILLAWLTLVPSSLCTAGMHELSDPEMASVIGSGFSTFSMDSSTGVVKLDFTGVTLSTWTEIASMKMGYYTKDIPNPSPPPLLISSTAWDNDWESVSLGSSGTPLVAAGLYIEAGFSNITDAANRQLNYLRIGTTNLTGDISAAFNSFSGTIDAGINVNGTPLGTAFTGTRDTTTLTTSTITAAGDGFYLALDRNGVSNQMGYSFHWVKN
jgi:hypothetical protein